MKWVVRHVVAAVLDMLCLQLVFISAGFDAAEGDPLGGCSVTPVGYSQMTHRLSALAEGRMVRLGMWGPGYVGFACPPCTTAAVAGITQFLVLQS